MTASQDQTRPAIPAASLRGMVRSIFETITLSCFSTFDAGSLDFRIGFSPDHLVDDAPAQASYIPCRIVKCDGESAVIQLLDGRLENPSDLPVVVSPALVRAYKNKVKSGEGPDSQWEKLGDAPDGTPVVAIIDWELRRKANKYRWRVATIPMSLASRHVLTGLDAEGRKSWITRIVDFYGKTFRETQQRSLVFGYLHRTGPNWREKKDERIFFSANTSYNNPNHPDYTDDLGERLDAYLLDNEKHVVVAQPVFRAALRMLKEYSARNGKKIKREFADTPRRQQQEGPVQWSKKPLPSDFILRHESGIEIKEGDLFYALIDERKEPEQQIRGLFPVAIPRLTHEESRGDLLPRKLYPCGRHHEICDQCSKLSAKAERIVDLCEDCKTVIECLCPACRVFGWTRDLTHMPRDVRKRLSSKADRVDAIAGHVRFTHGTLIGAWGQTDKTATRNVLGILSSPNPTATGFYLQAFEEFDAQKASRWPPVTGINERNPIANLPVYRRIEAQLKGRKMYRRREEAIPNPLNARQTDQNQTVHLLPPKLTFNFRVYFDNLTDHELGAMLSAMSLVGLGSDKEPRFHAIGHGKPFGLGRCSIVCKVVFDAEDRYSSTSFDGVTGSYPVSSVDVSKKIDTFTNQWLSATVSSNVAQMQDSLREMLSKIPNDLSVRYPLVPVDNAGRNADFAWWIAAKQNGTMLPDPVEERSDESKRLKL